jgi:uncharacterized membrane protein YdbT with pleckstrin-like domain
MGFLEESLGANESIILRGRIHWLLHAYYWLWLLVGEGLLIWARIALPKVVSLPVFAAITVVFVLIFLRYMIPVWSIEIGLTNYRIIVKRGWISRSTEELGLHAIEEVNLVQSVFGRIFGFGSLFVHGTGEDELGIEWLADPLEFRRAIETARENATRFGTQPKG